MPRTSIVSVQRCFVQRFWKHQLACRRNQSIRYFKDWYRFGLCFNAVYNLTDIPSFISREHLVVFDPNTHHLQRHIKDRSRPGIYINLVKKSLTRYKDQFEPFNGIFGCNTTQISKEFYYNGTLFRFPFRTTIQASTSIIIKTAYGSDKIQAIVLDICECASNIMIFSQHVSKVDVYNLKRSSQSGEIGFLRSVKKPSVHCSGLKNKS